jgi:pre-mRNA-splicing factor CWC22
MQVASAVRIPSPEPDVEHDAPRKRDRSPYSPGPSKRSRRQDGDDAPPRRDRSDRQRDTNGAKDDVPHDDARLSLFKSAFSASRKMPVDDSKTRACAKCRRTSPTRRRPSSSAWPGRR